MIRYLPTYLRPALLAALCCGVSGCAAIDRAMLGVDDNERVAALGEYAEPAGPMERFLVATGFKQKNDSPYMRPTVPPEAQRALDDAQRRFDAGDYKASEDAAHGLVKKYKNTVLEEDALFLEAESQYARKRYAAAQDTYSELFERFPSTRYMDRSTAHLFDIAQQWLRFPKVVKSAEIQPVNFEDPASTPLPEPQKSGFELTRAVPFLPNVFDRTRPVFDTDGNALAALKAIWLNDPTGPLADDALMLTASHYLRKGDYLEADHYYEILREEYPKSPHLEDAFVLGSHVKLMAYQGSAYDGTSLEEAERLKESTLKLFPNSPERRRIEAELKKIAEADVERQWEKVRLYQKKTTGLGGRYQRAVAMQCHVLLTEFPNSKYESQARRIWNVLPAETKKDLPPLPGQPSRTTVPDLAPIPNEPYSGADPPAGRVKL